MAIGDFDPAKAGMVWNDCNGWHYPIGAGVPGAFAPFSPAPTVDARDAELASLRSQLAALQAEAARVVGPFARMGDLINRLFDATESRPSLSEYGEHFLAARAFLTSLPSPAVVAVPIEPGEDDIEAMARAMTESDNPSPDLVHLWKPEAIARLTRECDDAVKAEREACAQLCRDLQTDCDLKIVRATEDCHTSEQHHQEGRWHALNDAVDAIRARARANTKEPTT